MVDARVLNDGAAVEVALDPVRAWILEALDEPGSATTVAASVGLTRQRVNCHLTASDAHGLAEPAETRRWGGITMTTGHRPAPGTGRLIGTGLLAGVVAAVAPVATTPTTDR